MAKTILIVEDNPKNRLLITDILKYYGYEVLEAEDGAEGLRMAGDHHPDLILLDMQMPRMDGYAFLKKIKEMPELNKIKIIAVTSYAMVGDREKIIQAGADDYFSKPIDTRKLPEMIRKHIGPAS